MKQESRDAFLSECKHRLKQEGIPEKDWVSDETMLAFYYGEITNNDLSISQKDLNIIKQNEGKANIKLINATNNLTKAKTKGQILENLIVSKYGEETAEQSLKNLQKDEGLKGAETENKKADTANKKQQNKANKWTESKQYQGLMIKGVALDNMKKQAEVDESKTRQAKNVAETAESITRSGKNIVDIITPFK